MSPPRPGARTWAPSVMCTGARSCNKLSQKGGWARVLGKRFFLTHFLVGSVSISTLSHSG